MKYSNIKNSNLRICKLFIKLLNKEDLEKIGREFSLYYLSAFNEIIKLSNHAVCALSVGVSIKLHIGRKNSVQYYFNNITTGSLDGLMKSCLLNGSIENFIKTASYENKLIKTLFDSISDRVKSWLINKVTMVNISCLNQYQFIEKKKGMSYITLTLYITAAGGLGGYMNYKDKNSNNNFGHLNDEHLIALYIDEFIEKYCNEIL